MIHQTKKKLALVAAVVTATSLGSAAQIGIDALRAPDGNPNPALSVDNSGNVGIGTTAPGAQLHVQDGGAGASPIVPNPRSIAVFERNTSAYLSVLTPALSESGVIFGNPLDTTHGGIVYNSAPALSGLMFRANGNQTKMTITSNGRVGIGTVAPEGFLDVRGSLVLERGQNAVLFTGTGTTELNRFLFLLNSPDLDSASGLKAGGILVSDRYSYASPGKNDLIVKGNIGVGTPNPQAKLDVEGQVRATTLLLTSDRHAKSDFRSVENQEVLKKLASLSITSWHYTNAPGVRHLGPMAQDFKAAFNLGEDDKHIATVDADGVALAAIQALHELVQEKNSEIAALQRQLAALKTELAGVKDTVTDRLASLEKALANGQAQAGAQAEAGR